MNLGYHQARSRLLTLAILVPLTCATPDVLGGTTTGDLQSIQIYELKQAAEGYKAFFGEYPESDENQTWYEKLIAAECLVEDHLWLGRRGFGLDYR